MYFKYKLGNELEIESESVVCSQKHDMPPFMCYSDPGVTNTRHDVDLWNYLLEHETFCSVSCDDFLNRHFDGRISREQIKYVMIAAGVESEPIIGAFYYMDKFKRLFPEQLRDMIAVHTEIKVVAMFTVISSKFIDDVVLANDVISRRMGFSSVGDFNRLEKIVFSFMNGDAYIPSDQHYVYRKHLGLSHCCDKTTILEQ